MLGYLDAGTGSIIVAALAGGVAGIALVIKLFWHRILGVFSRRHREEAAAAKERLVDSETSA